MLPANVELNDSYIYMHTNILEVNSIFRYYESGLTSKWASFWLSHMGCVDFSTIFWTLFASQVGFLLELAGKSKIQCHFYTIILLDDWLYMALFLFN